MDSKSNAKDFTDLEEQRSQEDLNLSVEELKAKLESMKALLAAEQRTSGTQSHPCKRPSIIDGTFLSAVFAVVFFIILGVSIHAFHNLYYAIKKKFPPVHTEL